MKAATLASRFGSLAQLWPLAVCLGCVIWAFLSILTDLWGIWATNPQYSHGYLVPLFAAYVLYARREQLRLDEMRPSFFGAALLVAGAAMRLYAAYYHYTWLDMVSIVPMLAGAWWMVGGMTVLRWSYPAILFLAFMVPLPYRVAAQWSLPLQFFATTVSTFLMQMLGLPALADGNIIRLNDAEIGVVEACSGLRMMVVFFALSTAMVMVIRKGWLEKVIILASAIPIALIANIARITATGILFETTSSEWAHTFFHDLAGWFMMPLALVLLYLELNLLSAIIVEDPNAAVRPTRAAVTTRRKSTPRPQHGGESKKQRTPRQPATRRKQATQPETPTPQPTPAETGPTT
jgi:exosortase